MKKLYLTLLCVLLAAVLTAPALADVIWEPDDDFYTAHYDECQLDQAFYEAKADAVIQMSPEDDAVLETVPAGETVYVSFTWNGWGYGELTGGWVDLSGFRRLYNEDDFLSAHQHELSDEEGTVSRAENDVIVLWTFPGSGTVAGIVERAEFDWAEDDPAYYTLWTDENGVRWGRVGYYYGTRGWICLDDPGADDLPAAAPYYAEEEPAAETPAWDPEPEPDQVAGLVIAIVAAVVLATAILLAVLLKKKRKTAD